LGVRRNIIRPTGSDLPAGESPFDSPEFVTHLMRVAKLWHYVLIGRVLAFLSFAFLPGLTGFLDHPSHWLVMAAGLPCDVALTVIGQAMRKPRPIAHSQVRLMAMLCMALIALGTLLNAAAMFDAMEAKLRARLGPHRDVEIVRAFDGQLVGQTWETPFVPVPAGDITPAAIEQMIANFHDAYFERNGNRFEAIPVQGVTYRLRAVVPTDKVSYAELPARNGPPLRAIGTSVLRYVADAEQLAQIYARDDLRAGDEIRGPAIVREALSTTYITQNQIGRIGRYGQISIERMGGGN